MKKNKKKISPKKSSLVSAENIQRFDDALNCIVKKRIGGVTNIRGVGFQFLYSVYIILNHLDEESNNWIRLEGIEDIDLHVEGGDTYLQVKTSQNTIDASIIWDLKVFQNFLDVYRINPASHFVLVHNTSLAKGNLDILGNGSVSSSVLDFWLKRFTDSGFDISSSDLQQLFNNIAARKITDSFLFTEIENILFNKYNVNKNAEQIFIKALFYHVFEWSKSKSKIYYQDVIRLIQLVKDSFSRSPTNPAIQNNWVTKVSFTVTDIDSDIAYFDGKAARPIDIARGLPVKRPMWEKSIVKDAENFDVTVIKSSSGQGKSTLAWLVAQTLTDSGYTIYQLQYCPSWNEISGIADFLATRISIGEIPVVVIDGFNSSLSGWNLLAEQLRSKPIKFIITTREEDWVRYSSEITNLTLTTIDIKLTEEEARNIFNELKSRNKLHNDVTTWQPAWEKIKDNGLLIEFVYLITQGQMLSTRLMGQIQKLNTEPSSGVKLEILRIIAIGDVLNIRLSTKALSKYLKTNFTIDTDQNEIYRQLEKEYYLNFSTSYVQGLHPVRSRHLIDILASHTPVEESLLSVLSIIDEDFIYDYFIGIPLQFSNLKKEFFENAAYLMAQRKPSEMVYAIDGLMHYEPLKYWLTNADVFNEVSKTGGIELFVYDSVPFSNLNTIDNLIASLSDSGMDGNLKFLSTKLKDLSKYKIEESEVQLFTKALSEKLSKRQQMETIEGVGFLYKWFKRLSISFPEIVSFSETELLKILSEKDITESSELFNFFHISNPEKFKQFIQDHKIEITGYLKIKTNSLSIVEEEEDIHIQYLLDKDADKANEMSVYRINIVFAFFPFYKHYCTSAIILPFPNENIYKVVKQNAHKAMPSKNITDTFDVHINQIWAKVLLDKYSYTSSYEWQKEITALRDKILVLIKKITYLFEAHIEKNQKSVNSQVKEVVALATEFFRTENSFKKYPSQNNKYFEKNSVTKYENNINSWRASFRNFLSQMSGIFSPTKEQDRNLPVINLNAFLYNLPGMHEAVDSIVNTSSDYFPSTTLIKDEIAWINRLHQTVNFYVNNTEKIIVASKSVKEWWQQKQILELNQLYKIIHGFEAESAFKFYLPDKIVQEENLRYCTIGVGNFNILDEEELFLLSGGLCDLADTGIHFFTLIIVDVNKMVVGGFRVGDAYFRKFKNLLNDEPIEESDWGSPMPIIPDENAIATIKEVKLKPAIIIPANEAYFSMLMNCWKLIEYRARLNVNSPVEKAWLDELEEEYKRAIMEDAAKLYCDNLTSITPNKDVIVQFLEGKIVLSNEQIISYMNEKALVINNQTYSGEES
jgi:hypothetical protein